MRSVRTIPGWPVAFAAAMLLYYLTASREIQWQDFGQFVQRVVAGELTTDFGLALSHPLHYWFCVAFTKVLPVEPPFAVSLVSSLFGAIAVANVFGLVRETTKQALPAILAACGLAVAHTWWRLSTMPECYTLAAALLTAEVWCILRWDRLRKPIWLVGMFFFNGLGLANHNVALLTGPVLTVVLILAIRNRQATWRSFLAVSGAWFIGASPFLYLIVRDIAGGAGFADTIRSALFGTLYESAVIGASTHLRDTAVSIAFTILSFPNLLLPPGVFGIVRGRRHGLPTLTYRAMLAGLLIHLAFVLRYDVADQYTFLLPAYALLGLFAGVGFSAWVTRRGVVIAAVVLTLLTPILYLFIADIARSANILGSRARNKPYREDYRYLFTPWGRGDDSAERMSIAVSDLAAPNGLTLVEEPMARFAIQYQYIMRNMPGATVLPRANPDVIRAASDAGRPVVFVPPSVGDVPAPVPFGNWEKVGEMFILRPHAQRGDVP